MLPEHVAHDIAASETMATATSNSLLWVVPICLRRQAGTRQYCNWHADKILSSKATGAESDWLALVPIMQQLLWPAGPSRNSTIAYVHKGGVRILSYLILS
jgi:hypothetical protein